MAENPMSVERFAPGDRVRITASGATGTVIRPATARHNGYRVKIDDAWLAGKPPFYERDVNVSPLNLERIRD